MEKLNLYQKIIKVMKTAKPLAKGGYNEKQSYSYVTHEDAIQVIKNAMCEVGLVVLSTITGKEDIERINEKTGSTMTFTKILVEHKLVDTDDPSVFCIINNYGYGADSLDKSIYKAMTGAKKYALFTFFMLSTGDDPELEKKSVKEIYLEDIANSSKVEDLEEINSLLLNNKNKISTTEINIIRAALNEKYKKLIKEKSNVN